MTRMAPIRPRLELAPVSGPYDAQPCSLCHDQGCKVVALAGTADIDAGTVTGAVMLVCLRCIAHAVGVSTTYDVRAVRRWFTRVVVEQCRGNRSKAARVLGVGRTTVWRNLKHTP